MKEYLVAITHEDMRRHTDQGYALLGAITNEKGFDPVAVVMLSTLIFNTHTWIFHAFVLKNGTVHGIELRDE